MNFQRVRDHVAPEEWVSRRKQDRGLKMDSVLSSPLHLDMESPLLSSPSYSSPSYSAQSLPVWLAFWKVSLKRQHQRWLLVAVLHSGEGHQLWKLEYLPRVLALLWPHAGCGTLGKLFSLLTPVSHLENGDYWFTNLLWGLNESMYYMNYIKWLLLDSFLLSKKWRFLWFILKHKETECPTHVTIVHMGVLCGKPSSGTKYKLKHRSYL